MQDQGMLTAKSSKKMCSCAEEVENSAIAVQEAAVSVDMFEVSASPSRLEAYGAESSLNPRPVQPLIRNRSGVGACGSRRSSSTSSQQHSKIGCTLCVRSLHQLFDGEVARRSVYQRLSSSLRGASHC